MSRRVSSPIRGVLSACCVLLGAGETSGSPIPRAALQGAKEERVVAAVFTAQPPLLDGILDEPQWAVAVPATGFVQSAPREGSPLTERTEVRVLYDRDNLYIGAYCYDADPTGVIVNALKRDFDSQEGDAFGLVLDVLHNARNSFSFFTNPGSAKRDAQSLEDGRYTNVQWDGVWHVKSAMRTDGWVAEIAIPFKTLGLRTQTLASMGINFKRRIRRKNEEGYWSPVPRRFTVNYVSLAGTLTGLGAVSGGRGLQLKPFATTDLRDGAAGNSGKAKVGIDAKYRVASGVALDLTYNTDFSHVEADTQQVNLTRFSPFFAEKREFFLENADLFRFGDVPGERSVRSEETQLFYTRRIGLSAAGEPVPLRGGARLSGRAGPWSVGFLGIHQPSTSQVAANTFSVARVRRDLFARSDAGLIVVSREGARPGDFNRSYGADLNLRSGPYWTANAFWAGTAGPGLRGGHDQKKVSTKWDNGIADAQLIAADIGPNFRPEVGFVPRVDVRSYQGNLGLRLRPASRRLVREWDLRTNLIYFTDRRNTALTKNQQFAINVEFRDGSRVSLSHNPQFERLREPFRIRPSVVVAKGDYAFDHFQLNYSSNRSKLLSTDVSLTRGGFYDGERTSASLGATLLLKPHLTAALSYERNAVDLPAGLVRADLYIARAVYSLDPRLFVDALVQYNAETKRILTTARFNFTYRPLSDFSIVLNEDRTTAASLAPKPGRALLLKYTRLLQF